MNDFERKYALEEVERQKEIYSLSHRFAGRRVKLHYGVVVTIVEFRSLVFMQAGRGGKYPFRTKVAWCGVLFDGNGQQWDALIAMDAILPKSLE